MPEIEVISFLKIAECADFRSLMHERQIRARSNAEQLADLEGVIDLRLETLPQFCNAIKKVRSLNDIGRGRFSNYSSSSSSLVSLKISQTECASCRKRCLFIPFSRAYSQASMRKLRKWANCSFVIGARTARCRTGLAGFRICPAPRNVITFDSPVGSPRTAHRFALLQVLECAALIGIAGPD